MKISSSMFTYSKQDQQLVAEISSLERFRFAQLYADACDIGLTVVSATTGAEVDYAIAEERKSEGEIQSWLLKPTAASVRSTPSAAKTSILIIND